MYTVQFSERLNQWTSVMDAFKVRTRHGMFYTKMCMAIENWWHRGGTRQWKYLYVQCTRKGSSTTDVLDIYVTYQSSVETTSNKLSLIFTKTSHPLRFGKGTLWEGPYIVCRIVIFGIMRVTEKVFLIDYPEPMISFFFA